MSEWSLPKQAHEFLFQNLPYQATVIELGSGEGSKALTEYFNLISVEHDPAWAAKQEHAVIVAPLIDGWYDPAFLAELPSHYDAVIVDGPPGSTHRCGFYAHWRSFNGVPLLIDDCHRPAEAHMASAIADRDRSLSYHKLADGRMFATIGWW